MSGDFSSGSSVLGPFHPSTTVAPIAFERINSIWLPRRGRATGGSVFELSPSVITKSESNVCGESFVGPELEGIFRDEAKSSGTPALLP